MTILNTRENAVTNLERTGLDEIAEVTGTPLSHDFREWLTTHRLSTLADLRAAGPLAAVDELPFPAESSEVRALDAIASLADTTADLADATALFQRGFERPADLTRLSRAELGERVGDAIDAAKLDRILDAASATERLSRHAYTMRRLDGLTPGTEAASSALTAAAATCGCPDCLHAASPAAYLAELLDYTLRHLRRNGAAVTLTTLEEQYQQPFRRLSATCAATKTEVRQIRICIEVLRGYVSARGGSFTTPGAYLEAAYRQLLQEIGTSFEEIREARTGRPRDRRALADKLAIRLAPGRPDPLDELFRDPSQPGAITEEWLETVFGLRDTARDPLAPTPDPALLAWRREYLESLWIAADWPTPDPAGALPLIDADLVDPLDFADPTPSTVAGRTARRPMDFWEDRTAWTNNLQARFEATREDPNGGLDPLLQDRDANGNPLLLGTPGRSIDDFLQLKRRRDANQEDISPELDALSIGADEFDLIVSVCELERAGAPVLPAEWSALYDVLIQRAKRASFSGWRAEERAAGVVLTGRQFRLRSNASTSTDRAWWARPGRASPAARDRWVETLEFRIAQEERVGRALAQASDRTEDRYLAELRNALVRAIMSPTPANRSWLTRRLQIDVDGGPCRKTTRILQATETIQGVLFGARNGLLEDGSLTLAADRFDEEWRWIGTYPTWRAAMLTFLYPEGTLRPTLRAVRTDAFDAMVESFRAAGSDLEAGAVAEIVRPYEEFFADMATLRPAAVASVPGLLPDDPGEADVGVAQGDRTGTLYTSTWKRLPGYGASGNPLAQTPWTAIPGFDPSTGATLVGLVPYQLTTDRGRRRESRVAAFAASGEATLRAATDGVRWWRLPPLPVRPGLLLTASYPAERAADAAPATAALPWISRPGDVFAIADIDGDGREEVVVLTGTPAGSRRAVAVLRARGGGLAVQWSGTIDAKWTFPESGPVAHQIVAEDRLLLVARNPGAADELAALAWQNGQFAVLHPTSLISSTGTPPETWQVAIGTGDGRTEFALVGLEGGARSLVAAAATIGSYPVPNSPATAIATISWTAAGFSLRNLHELPGKWHSFTPIRSSIGPQGSRDQSDDLLTVDLFVREERRPSPNNTLRGDRLDVWVEVRQPRLRVLRWDNGEWFFVQPLSERLVFDGILPSGVEGLPDWELDDRDLMIPVRPARNRRSDDLVILSPSRGKIARATYDEFSLRLVWTRDGDIDGGSPSVPQWIMGPDDRAVAADIDGDGQTEIIVYNTSAGRLAVLEPGPGNTVTVAWAALNGLVSHPEALGSGGWPVEGGAPLLTGDLDGDGAAEVLVRRPGDTGNESLGLLHGTCSPPWYTFPSWGPAGVSLTDLTRAITNGERDRLRTAGAAAYQATLGGVSHNLLYLDEAYYFVPMEVALRLKEAGRYQTALDWYRGVFDYQAASAARRIAYKLVRDDGQPEFAREVDWLRDPLNPHAIAEVRKGSYRRYTLLAVVRCLLAYADAEFARATGDSLARALNLYLKALELLDDEAVAQHDDRCADLIGELTLVIGSDEPWWRWAKLFTELQAIPNVGALQRLKPALESAITASQPLAERVARAESLVSAAMAEPPPDRSLEAVVARNAMELRRQPADWQPADRQPADRQPPESGARTGARMRGVDRGRSVADELALLELNGNFAGRFPLGGVVPAPSIAFCIPRNPLIDQLRRHVAVNLLKLRTCRTISGLPLRLPTSVEISADSRLATAFDAERLPVIERPDLRPLPYRYATLIERAKQLVELARQIEASMLGSIEAADRARYEELRARQDLQLARGAERLRELEATTASDQVAGAELQVSRAATQQTFWRRRVYQGWSLNEQLQVGHLAAAAAHQHAAAGADWAGIYSVSGFFGGAGSVGRAIGSTASALSMTSQVFALYGSFERREQEWRLAAGTASADRAIAEQQVRVAQDGVRVAAQELRNTRLQVDQAETSLEFYLTKRFGTADLYDWMSGVLEDIYRYILQQATAMAKLAELQLTFERQDPQPLVIKQDYWVPEQAGRTPDFTGFNASGQTANLRGLTGSARLLRDILELDQRAFTTNQRKLQLAETISLAQLDPMAFQLFRQTGTLPFQTPLELFDRRFPGHYLRLVRRVRTSIIALVPPSMGIRATLAVGGVSRVVLGNESFETASIYREPEQVALSSAFGASGLFELDAQPELLMPFEGMGVDAAWELRLPRAANSFDFETIADVLITVEYTALSSDDLRQRVIESQGRRVTADRPFSFRHHFADAWYDLNNPDQATPPPLKVTFATTRADFPANIDALRVDQLVLYFVQPGQAERVTVLDFGFTPPGGPRYALPPAPNGFDTTDDGRLSTRSGNWAFLAGAPQPLGVEGTWDLQLADTPAMRARLASGAINNILLVVTFRGAAPAWPS